MAKAKFEICNCCGQVITKHTGEAGERHLRTIDALYGVTFDDIKGHNKTSYIVEARQHFWFLLCVEDEWSFPRAGKKTGHDHTTVVYGVKKFARELLGTHKRASIQTIVKAYWLAVGLTEEEANAKAKARAFGK